MIELSIERLILLPPTLILYILGAKAEIFPRFEGVVKGTAAMLLQLIAIRELIQVFLDLYVTYCL